jgi:hypothetical protein
MAPNPFVWEVQVRREVLDEEMARLQEIPYSVWRDAIRKPITKQVTARDNKSYRLTVHAEFVHKDRGDIRVTLLLAKSGLVHRRLLRQSFVITPQNAFHV